MGQKILGGRFTVASLKYQKNTAFPPAIVLIVVIALLSSQNYKTVAIIQSRFTSSFSVTLKRYG
jgi:hypothetical protein